MSFFVDFPYARYIIAVELGGFGRSLPYPLQQNRRNDVGIRRPRCGNKGFLKGKKNEKSLYLTAVFDFISQRL